MRSHFDPSTAMDAPESYERYFVPSIGRPVAEGLLRVAAVRPGERVLDVGCGTGVVTRRAAERAGPEGGVVGLDLHPGMLEVARTVAPADLGIEWCEASAESIPFPDGSFDVVLCQMSLQFVPDRREALAEMRRVLVDGGRLALNVPGPASPVFESMADAMGRHVSEEAAAFVRAVFALHDETELQALAEHAGFRDVEVSAEAGELALPPPAEFLWQYVASTPLAGAVAEADDAARSALEEEVVERWGDFEDGDGLSLRQRMVIVTGRR